ncbi:MAG: NUDIX domain-containing protein [Chitinispirillaceae bacterium]|nr:NUDIX domain-containing protein [Chitinispirillaceae bacterium]
MKSFTQFTFCPRCASDRIEVHMKNAIRCDSCGYVYFHNCAAAVAAIVEIDRKVLLLKRAHDPQKGLLDVPGGFVDYRESLETALRREVKEECGIELTDLRYFGSFPNRYHYLDVTYFSADAYFLCTAGNGSAPGISEETSEVVILEPEAIDEKAVAFDSVKQALHAYRTL